MSDERPEDEDGDGDEPPPPRRIGPDLAPQAQQPGREGSSDEVQQQ